MKPGRLRIATWNLDRVRPGTGVRTERIRAAIEKVDSDVWVLTETHERFSPGEQFIEKAFSFAPPYRQNDERWVSIWVRRDLDTEALTVDGEPERSAAARIKLGEGRHLVVFGTVLPWRGDTATELRGAAKFVTSLTKQARDWERLRYVHVGDHLCVAGDFNQEFQSNGPVGTKLGRDALDAELRPGQHGQLECVTGGERDPLLKLGRGKSIDHILLDVELAYTAQVCKVWPDEYPLLKRMSDHYGVCVELQTGVA